MKNQIISGVEWSMDIFNCSFHAFSRLLLLLLRRSSEHSVWLKLNEKSKTISENSCIDPLLTFAKMVNMEELAVLAK